MPQEIETALEKDAREDREARLRLGSDANVKNIKELSLPHKKPPSMIVRWFQTKDRMNKRPDSSDGVGR